MGNKHSSQKTSPKHGVSKKENPGDMINSSAQENCVQQPFEAGYSSSGWGRSFVSGEGLRRHQYFDDYDRRTSGTNSDNFSSNYRHSILPRDNKSTSQINTLYERHERRRLEKERNLYCNASETKRAVHQRLPSPIQNENDVAANAMKVDKKAAGHRYSNETKENMIDSMAYASATVISSIPRHLSNDEDNPSQQNYAAGYSEWHDHYPSNFPKSLDASSSHTSDSSEQQHLAKQQYSAHSNYSASKIKRIVRQKLPSTTQNANKDMAESRGAALGRPPSGYTGCSDAQQLSTDTGKPKLQQNRGRIDGTRADCNANRPPLSSLCQSAFPHRVSPIEDWEMDCDDEDTRMVSTRTQSQDTGRYSPVNRNPTEDVGASSPRPTSNETLEHSPDSIPQDSNASTSRFLQNEDVSIHSIKPSFTSKAPSSLPVTARHQEFKTKCTIVNDANASFVEDEPRATKNSRTVTNTQSTAKQRSSSRRRASSGVKPGEANEESTSNKAPRKRSTGKKISIDLGDKKGNTSVSKSGDHNLTEQSSYGKPKESASLLKNGGTAAQLKQRKETTVPTKTENAPSNRESGKSPKKVTSKQANEKSKQTPRKGNKDEGKATDNDVKLTDLSFQKENIISINVQAQLSESDFGTYLKSVIGDIPFTCKTDVCCGPGEFLVVFPSKHKAENTMKRFEERREDGIVLATLVSPVAQYKRQLQGKQNQACEHHRKRTESTVQSIDKLSKGGKGKKTKFVFLNVHEKITTLKEKKEEFDGQLNEFIKFCDEVSSDLDNLPPSNHTQVQLTELSKRFNRELHRFQSALPIYAKKTRIIDTVKANQVCIVIGETGSGKSTQMTQYLCEAGLAHEGLIVCTQPRKVAATSLAQQVSKEMGSNTGNLVGYTFGSSRETSQSTKVIYTTDHALLMEFIKDPCLNKYSCVIIDEAHERSINTDLLIGMLKQALPTRPDLRVVITSATIDPKLFQNYFGGCPVIKVSGRTFPVDIIWKEVDNTISINDDYVSEAVQKVMKIHNDEGPGDILVFLTSPVEIDRACDKVTSKLNKHEVVCLPLHGKLQQEDQQKVFQSFPGKRKIVFSTNCAETSVTIPGIKFVVDTGRAKEMRYDEKRGLNILEVSIISQSSAEQRKGRAGRTDSGKCYRLYTYEDFRAMEKGTRPEILRVHLGQAVVRLMELGVSDPAMFDYVEPPPEDSIKCAVSTLVKLGAVKDGRLTEFGRKISKVPLEPRLAKLLFDGIDKGVGYESLVICSVATVNGSVFFRMGSEEEKKEADTRKFEFCHLEGDYLTLLNVYREWWNEDPRDRGRWCFAKSLNGKALRMAEETMKDLKFAIEYELGITEVRKWKWSTFDEAKSTEILQKNIFSCFFENLCVFTGHNRVGYKEVNGGFQVKLHPSSSLNFMAAEPKFLVYEKTLRTSQDFIINVTPIQERWLEEAIACGQVDLDLHKIDEEMLFPVQINCSQTLRKIMLSPVKEKIEKLRQHIASYCDNSIVSIECKYDSGLIEVFIPRQYHEKASKVVQDYLEEGRKQLRNDTYECPVVPSSTDVPRLVLGKGCVVNQILMPGMYREVVARYSQEETDPQEVLETLSQFGVLLQYSVQDAVIYGSYGKAEEAEQAVDGCRDQQFKVFPNQRQNQSAKRDQEVTFDFGISWKRRRPTGRAIINFSRDPEYQALIVSSMNVRYKTMQIRSSRVRMSADRFQPHSVFISNLDKETTKMDIKTAVENRYPEVTIHDVNNQIFLHYEKVGATTDDDLARQTGVLRPLMEEIAPNSDFELKLQKPRAVSDIMARAIVKFKNSNEGVKAAKSLDGKTVFNLEQWIVQLEVSCFLKSYLTCPKYIYNAVKEEIEVKMSEVSLECNQQCHQNTIFQCPPTKSKTRVALRVDSQCIDHYAEATVAIGCLLKGEKIDCSITEHHTMLLTKTGRCELQKIEKMTGTVIRAVDQDVALYVYGTVERTEAAVQAIHAFVQNIALSGGSEAREVDLRESGRPRGLLKELFRQFGRDLSGLSTIPGVHKVSVDLRKHVVTLLSTSDAHGVVLQKIEEVSKGLPQADGSEVAGDGDMLKTCPVCICDVEKPSYWLASCGHEYCKSCVKALIKAKEFPLRCAHKNCSVLTLSDLNSLLHGDEKEDLTKGALKWYIDANPDKVRCCPSPDCAMVYRVTSVSKRFKCSMCSGEVCTFCHEFYHMGLTCEEYKLNKTEHGQDLLVEKWMSEDPSNRKRCPKCRAVIEKKEGCNHMQCTQCKAHMCWLCLKVYPTNGGVYGHQASCPNNNV